MYLLIDCSYDNNNYFGKVGNSLSVFSHDIWGIIELIITHPFKDTD